MPFSRPDHLHDGSLFSPKSKPGDHGFLLNAYSRLKRGRYIIELSYSKIRGSLSLPPFSPSWIYSK